MSALLDQLMDVIIQVTNADKGFIVLMESGEPVVKVARNLRRETISRRRQPPVGLDPGQGDRDAGSR